MVKGYDDLWVLQYASPEKAENAYNAKMAQQNEPVFNGEPEYRYDDTDTNN